MKRRNYMMILASLLLCSCLSCGNKNKASEGEESKVLVKAPEFDADSAYQYVQAQVDFGPRVPNTKQHVECGNYLAAKLESFGAKVTSQYADLIAFDGTILKSRNIIGSYKPELKKRIVLFAHWDSRPWADKDPDRNNHRTPVLGANDGASGVGVLLEIARLQQQQQPTLGIDLIFLDAEDYGSYNVDESWCLGAQYWARTPHVQGYNARFGILLDMVGGKTGTFLKESYSEEFAPNINKKVWKKANELGYGRYFVNEKGGYTTDDHLYINKIAQIPTIDIVSYYEEGSFDPTWHTANDNMDNIDRNTMKAVGQTVLEVIYNEK